MKACAQSEAQSNSGSHRTLTPSPPRNADGHVAVARSASYSRPESLYCSVVGSWSLNASRRISSPNTPPAWLA